MPLYFLKRIPHKDHISMSWASKKFAALAKVFWGCSVYERFVRGKKCKYDMLMNLNLVHTDTSLSYCKLTEMGLPLITEPRSCSP